MASKSSSSGGGSGIGGNSVTDVLDRVIGLRNNNNNNNNGNDNNDDSLPAAFIASDKWSGIKHGYVYRTSSEFGTGYHLDNNTASNGSSSTSAPVSAAASSSSLSPALKSSSSSLAAASAAAGRENKRARFDTSRDITHAIPARPSKHPHSTSTTATTTTGEELLAQAEASFSQQQQQSSTKLLELSIRGIHLASTSLLKTHQRNSILRAQHPNDPEKYMLEELALHDEIMNFTSAAVNLSLYEHVVNNGVIHCFVELMNHDNVDVGLCVVNVLMELLDPTLLSSSRENEEKDDEDNEGKKEIDPMEKSRNMALLANAFLDGGGLELLSSNLGRLDESVDEEEAKGVEDILTLVESLLDLDRMGVLLTQTSSSSSSSRAFDGDEDNNSRSSVVACICQQTTFLSWLFQRIEKSDSSSTENDAALNNATAAAAAAAAAPISPAVLKLHASEVLSAILQHEDYSMQRCGGKLATLPQYTSVFTDTEDEDATKMGKRNNNNNNPTTTIDGMEILLLAIAAYRKSDPQIEVECEFLENVFDALAASLLREDNVVDFVEAEGIELMLRCLRQNVHAGGGALKVLNFALSAAANEEEVEDDGASSTTTTTGANNAYRKACETFIQAGGLKIIFPLYMGRKSAIPCPAACSDGGSNLAKRGNKNGGYGAAAADAGISKRAKRAAQARKQWLVEVEQNTIHIIYALTRHIAKDSQYDAHARLLVKFLEEDCEKCDRTIELCLKYDEKARIAEYQYFRSDEAEEAEEMGINVETAALGAKLRGGGDMFHRTCAILSFACVGSKRCHAHSLDQVKLQGSGISVIKDGLNEFASLLRDGQQKSQIEHYITSI